MFHNIIFIFIIIKYFFVCFGQKKVNGLKLDENRMDEYRSWDESKLDKSMIGRKQRWRKTGWTKMNWPKSMSTAVNVIFKETCLELFSYIYNFKILYF